MCAWVHAWVQTKRGGVAPGPCLCAMMNMVHPRMALRIVFCTMLSVSLSTWEQRERTWFSAHVVPSWAGAALGGAGWPVFWRLSVHARHKHSLRDNTLRLTGSLQSRCATPARVPVGRPSYKARPKPQPAQRGPGRARGLKTKSISTGGAIGESKGAPRVSGNRRTEA